MYAPEGSRLKIWLFGGVEISTDNALFDLEEYKGAITSDLFEEESYFGDTAAFWDLQRTVIARAKAYNRPKRSPYPGQHFFHPASPEKS
ncbi:hypothetical protein [uncultured Roseobacter sp.]|uniref:hypothetical protein n=1 Tax=uncultured Roseobacter sp. TaxID=114847 RepID=UPI0026065F61|nr:hypothetical protein [uncultured Roseobacter sp.]